MIVSKKIMFFLGHLSCSIVIALIIIGLVFFVWYPAPLAHAEGVTHIFLIIIMIDLIIGPLLTLLVYKEGKKTLKMDLIIIILIQFLALSYGLYSIIQTRPVWIVQNGSIFQLVRANAIDIKDQQSTQSKYQKSSWFKSKWVAVDEKNPNYNKYIEPTIVPKLYIDLSFAKPRIIKNAQPLARLNKYNNPKKVQDILDKYPLATSWLPLRTTGLGCVVLVNSKSGEIIKVVDLRPWIE